MLPPVSIDATAGGAAPLAKRGPTKPSVRSYAMFAVGGLLSKLMPSELLVTNRTVFGSAHPATDAAMENKDRHANLFIGCFPRWLVERGLLVPPGTAQGCSSRYRHCSAPERWSPCRSPGRRQRRSPYRNRRACP